jgi:hypothetical protein
MRNCGAIAVLSLSILIAVGIPDVGCAQETGYATSVRTPEPSRPRAIRTVRIVPDASVPRQPPTPKSEATTAPTATIARAPSPPLPTNTIRTVTIRPDGTVQPKSDAPPLLDMPKSVLAQTTRAVLYEENARGQTKSTITGTAAWRTERDAQSNDLFVRADVEFPERRIVVTWVLRRNSDTWMPASHLIDMFFRLPSDFPNGSVSNVPGFLMKTTELTSGAPLAGTAMKMSQVSFRIGLSREQQVKNLQLLADNSWMEIPIHYGDGTRAIVAIDKGVSGERVINQVVASWRRQ